MNQLYFTTYSSHMASDMICNLYIIVTVIIINTGESVLNKQRDYSLSHRMTEVYVWLNDQLSVIVIINHNLI